MCGSVVKRRSSLNTDQVALISLRGGSRANFSVAQQTQYTTASKPNTAVLIGRHMLIQYVHGLQCIKYVFILMIL